LDSKAPQLGGFAWRSLCLYMFAILLLTTSCSRYPNAEATRANGTGKGALGGSADTHAPNLDSSLLSKWNQLVRETIEQSARERRVVLIINKCRHTLSAYKNGYRVAEYHVDLGPNAIPKRLCEDQATPEGKYQIVKKLGPGETKHQMAFVINCSNAPDRRAFRMLQRDSQKRLKIGGNIAIRGGSGIQKDKNWTFGDIALDDEAFDEIFPYVVVSTPVTIVAYETIQPERKHQGGQ